MLLHFDWDLNFVQPVNFVRLFLAQGILFSSELKIYKKNLERDEYLYLIKELSRTLCSEALNICDMLTIKGSCLLREK